MGWLLGRSSIIHKTVKNREINSVLGRDDYGEFTLSE